MLHTGIIIQARMGSAHLPGKVLLNLAGKPVLWHILDRCSHILGSRIIVATSDLAQDKPIVKLCHTYHIPVFIGSETNVLSRYYLCAKTYHLDIILRVSGDCPLTEPFIMRRCLTDLVNCQGDFCTTNRTNIILPLGLGTSAFTFAALQKVYRKAKSNYDREHVDPYIYAHPYQFKICPVKLPSRFAATFRLTLDEPADYKLLSHLFDQLYSPSHGISTIKVLAYLKSHPKLSRLNQNIVQRT